MRRRDDDISASELVDAIIETSNMRVSVVSDGLGHAPNYIGNLTKRGDRIKLSTLMQVIDAGGASLYVEVGDTTYRVVSE